MCKFCKNVKSVCTRATNGQTEFATICAPICARICTLAEKVDSRTKSLFFHEKMHFRPKTAFFLFLFFQKNL